MHADYSVELGRDDAALELPWSSADPAVRYHDLKKNPGLLREIPETAAYPELGAFLARINAAGFPLSTAKCDAWTSREVAPEEDIFGDRKFVSYVDLVFEDEVARGSFEKHEAFAKALCRLLSQTPEIPAAVEIVIRRCYYHGKDLSEVADVAKEGGAGGAEEERLKAEGGLEIEEINRENSADEKAINAAGVGEGTAAEVVFEVEGRTEAGNDPVRVECETEGGAVLGSDAVEVEYEAEDRAEIASEALEVGGRNIGGAGAGSAAVEVECNKIGGGGAGSEAEEVEYKKIGGTGATSADPAQNIRLTDIESRPHGLAEGFCFTAYVTGFGDSDHEPRLRWQIALALLQNALVQLSR